MVDSWYGVSKSDGGDGVSENLSANELLDLVRRVFRPRPDDTGVAVLVDLPHTAAEDSASWRERRSMAAEWARELAAVEHELQLPVRLYLYPAVGQNNADLPERAWPHVGPPPPDARGLTGAGEPLAVILDSSSIILAPTQYSATAPLKVLAPEHGFRAATMPGFSRPMIPALRLDYGEVNRRVHLIKAHLDVADEAALVFAVDGVAEARLTLDLRHRTAHASGGLLHEPGTAGNLPSGESYIVPYEGEVAGDPSRSRGDLPVQLGEDVVTYRIEANRAVSVTGEGATAQREAERLATEPAYGNLAELGLGVLGGMGVEPVGEILLDEKLGLHIAFGRSDHFGGAVGPGDFSSPSAVVHQDRVYLPRLQPRIRVVAADLRIGGGEIVPLIRDDVWVLRLESGG